MAEAIFHPEALADYVAALSWYGSRSVVTASRFAAETERVVE